MSLKNIIIAIGISIGIAVLATMLYFFPKNKEIVSQEKSESQSSSTSIVLPSGTESSGSQENAEDTRRTFENITQETISDKTIREGSKKIDFKNQKGNSIPLSDFEDTLSVEIYPEIKGYLGNGYQIFYCPGPSGGKEFGLYLEYNMDKIYRGFTYDVLDMMKSWENKIFSDLHTVLFPDIDFNEVSLNQKIEFQDGKYRYTELNLPDGEKRSINYDAVEFGIIITTSPSCLDNVRQYYEPIGP